jgi:hypothetical protein
MGNVMHSFLKALLNHIEDEGPVIFASESDADYFRKTYRKLEAVKPVILEAPKPAPNPVVVLPPAPPKSAHNPVVALPPAPPKPPPEPIVNKGLVKPSIPAPLVNFTSVRNVLSIVAPELAIINEIPSDDLAKKLSERWKTKNQTAPLSILVYQESAEQRALLESIAKALDVYFGPAKLVNAEGIEKAKQWEMFLSVKELKMIIACDYTLWQLSSLMQFYKETPAQGSRLLGNVPLFLLPDLSLYLKDAKLKRSLWKAICQKCS